MNRLLYILSLISSVFSYSCADSYRIVGTSNLWEVDGKTITIRTTVMRKADKTLYTPADFLNKTIDVTGIVDFFSGEYQIKVFSAKNIEIHE